MTNEFIDKLRKHCNVLEGAKKQLESTITTLEIEIKDKKDLALEIQQVLTLLNQTSISAREKAKQHLEKIVTMALQYVHDDYCEFSIELGQARGTTVAEFYIITEVNGEISKQKPQDACGGGYVDVVSATLRYAYMRAFNQPTINNAIFLDEPGKMVSELASVRFAEFIKKLGQMFDKQTIMITHNESLKLVADHSVRVSKVGTESKITYNDTEDEDVQI